jgi:pimeloyl-ACP methyl ester carboxylesterase
MSALTYSAEDGVHAWRGGVAAADAPPLVFLHAGGTGADAMRRLAEPFAAYRQVIVPNFPGYGDAPTDPAVPAIAERVALVETLLHRLSAPVDIVGHSMGGFMALQASRHWPDRIGRLVAIEPVAFGAIATGDPADEAALAIDQAGNKALVEAYDRGDREEGIAAFISLWNGTPWAALPEPVRAALMALAPTLRREADAVSNDRTPASAYAHLGERLCVIVAEHSPPPAQRIAIRLNEACKGSRLVRIAGAGHMGPMQKPVLFRAAIADFLGIEGFVNG